MAKIRCLVKVLFSGLIIALAIGSASAAHMQLAGDDDWPNLTQQKLSELTKASGKGNCTAAYRVAVYHLYVSSDMQQAEKHYRRAVKCPIADAFAGLITVLRRPEDDAEIDELLVTLKKLDPKLGESAAIDVADRRGDRTMK